MITIPANGRIWPIFVIGVRSDEGLLTEAKAVVGRGRQKRLLNAPEFSLRGLVIVPFRWTPMQTFDRCERRSAW